MSLTADTFNWAAAVIFGLAIAHTFLCGPIHHRAARVKPGIGRRIGLLLGEVEVVFGLWVIALAAAALVLGRGAAFVTYLSGGGSFVEPLFVAIVMVVAATWPVMDLAERALRGLAGFGGGKPAAWWLAILIVAPLLGSLITEPAAMTIGAILLGHQFYALKPSGRLAYATLGLLFVNVSVGGTLTQFAAPPVVMVARPWGWGLTHMLTQFGWRAVVGIVLGTAAYYFLFRREFARLGGSGARSGQKPTRRHVPFWITGVHLGFLAFIVWAAHAPVLMVGGLLVFLGFVQVTKSYQEPIKWRSPILVGVFLAGLVVHGGLQGWWLRPLVGGLGAHALFGGATLLTAVNDNAAIAYLATLVPNLNAAGKYAVVAGAVTGGGLTVIANAPNPAGQSILAPYFAGGISPLRLLAAALLPTLIMSACFLL